MADNDIVKNIENEKFEEIPLIFTKNNNNSNKSNTTSDEIVQLNPVCRKKNFHIIRNKGRSSLKTKIIKNDLTVPQSVTTCLKNKLLNKNSNELLLSQQNSHSNSYKSIIQQQNDVVSLDDRASLTSTPVLNESINAIVDNTSIKNCTKYLYNYQNRKTVQRFKLIHQADIHVCKLQYSRTMLSKILNLRLLRRWKLHKLILTDTEITSTTQTDYMENIIPYSSIEDVSPITKWEPGQKFCLRIATFECLYLIQASSAYTRDQWLHSINWKRHKFKSERLIRVAIRPEVLIKEIKNVIEMSTSVPLEDGEIYQYPLELISDILQHNNLLKSTHEEVIVALGPLLEKNNPSPEICDFFSKHCHDSPRSKIVIEMFTPVVQRILKHNNDFGRYPRMRQFVQDYLMALRLQNAGLNTVQKFVIKMHTTSSQCPFPRVLYNFVSVCLAGIHNCFEQRRNLKDTEELKLIENDLDEQLICYTTMLHTMSTYEDWRLTLGPLLQSIPFPDESLSNPHFYRIISQIIKNISEDLRCEVHQTLLGMREGKEGWLELLCPGSANINDDSELFTIMLNTLVTCCCKKKRFLLSINKLLPQILLMALRENGIAIETLCAMLDLDAIENRDNKLQVISTLQSTQNGTKMYSKVCERLIQLRELQQKGGPRKLTLPSRSTDADLAKLLLSGCFGNLECLSLAFTNVTSACAEYLIKLPSLKYLNLWSTQFGDQGLELISEHLQRLQVLNLCETPVTDKGLSCLASMKQLRKLNLNSTNLSALTFEGLKECLPALQECDIRYTDAW